MCRSTSPRAIVLSLPIGALGVLVGCGPEPDVQLPDAALLDAGAAPSVVYFALRGPGSLVLPETPFQPRMVCTARTMDCRLTTTEAGRIDLDLRGNTHAVPHPRLESELSFGCTLVELRRARHGSSLFHARVEAEDRSVCQFSFPRTGEDGGTSLHVVLGTHVVVDIRTSIFHETASTSGFGGVIRYDLTHRSIREITLRDPARSDRVPEWRGVCRPERDDPFRARVDATPGWNQCFIGLRDAERSCRSTSTPTIELAWDSTGPPPEREGQARIDRARFAIDRLVARASALTSGRPAWSWKVRSPRGTTRLEVRGPEVGLPELPSCRPEDACTLEVLVEDGCPDRLGMIPFSTL